jgi:hypothetical protein
MIKVKIWCCTHDIQSDEEEVMEFPDDVTDEELESAAEEFMWSAKEPEWGFERLSGQGATSDE